MLDEPFNGLDPEGIAWMRGLLTSLAGQGRAVLVASHLMSELQHIAGHVVIAGRGRVLADTTLSDLLAAVPGAGAGSLEEAYFALTRDAAEFRGEAAR
jgi:ABC-2 type transport system ATP-binding protein